MSDQMRKVTCAVLAALMFLMVGRPALVRAAGPISARDMAALKLTLGLLVNRSASAAGLKVSALAANIDPTAVQYSATRSTGNGVWSLKALDDQQKAVTLEGSLTFEMTSAPQGTPGAGTSASIKGALRGEQIELTLEAAQDGKQAPGVLNSNETYQLQLSQAGKVSKASIRNAEETRTLAHNIVRSVANVSADRDGRQLAGTRTVTIRTISAGESEIWVKLNLGDAADPSLALSLEQHFFQRAAKGEAHQFYDQYKIQVLDSAFTLQAPAGVSLQPDGKIQSDLTLVDKSGKPLALAAPRPASNTSTGNATDTPSSLALVSYRPAPVEGATPPMGGLIVPLPAIMFESSSLCDLANSPFGSIALGIGITALLSAFGIGEFIIADAIACALASTTLSLILSQAKNSQNGKQISFINGIGQIALGIGGLGCGGVAGLLGGLGSAVIGAGCNADPYFFYPDIRQTTARPPGGAVQITRTTGGLVNPDSIKPAPGAQEGQSTGAAGYDDRPESFVGGAVPSGAMALGAWQWDPDRTFGAAPTHTQAKVDGPQKHYFIRAATPLKAGGDDNLIQYVYLDPKNPPTQIYLQFYTGDGDGEHRATWGADRVQTGGKPGTASLYPMGPLPATGGWVRLKIPADALGLVDKPINGVLYGALDGQTWWGPTTASSRLTDRAPDGLPVSTPESLPATDPGAQIAYQLADPARVTVTIVNASGATVRTLRDKQDTRAGYGVLVWDGKTDKGEQAADDAYRVRFIVGDKPVAESPVSLSPFVARIVTPSALSLVRGNDVPIIGEAYGTAFSRYVLEYGEGLNPATWKPITTSEAPALLPVRRPASINRIGSLANWNTGVSEFKPWQNEGLNGLYTLRLRVIGKDGREATDSVPVIVGRLAHSAEGGLIASPDGKARLSVPPLAVEGTFSLLALIPLEQLEPDGGWRAGLPGDKKLVGPVYEAFPADERFRRPATLELPYDGTTPPEKVGIMIGDGQKWSYLGGQADPARKVVSVPVSDFGGQRALLAAFSADQFGPAQVSRAAGTPLTFAPNAPLVNSTTHPAAFYWDFVSGAGDVSALDQFGTQLTVVRGTEAGLPGENAALRVARLPDGVRLVRVHAIPYDGARYPILTFDYRLPPNYVPNLLVRSNGVWWQFRTGPGKAALSRYYTTLDAPAFTADGAWHHYQIDLAAWLRANLPADARLKIDEIAFGQAESGAYMQVNLVDRGGTEPYYLANIAALAPVANLKPAFAFTQPPGTAYAGYSVALDQKSSTEAPTQDGGPAPAVTLPADAPDGLWYAHVRGKTADGKWSATAHYPLLLDRQPPTIGQPAPAPNGSGAPTLIQVPVLDSTSGIDPASFRFSLNGQSYGPGRGIRYSPEHGAFEIPPYALEPALPPIANGQNVEVTITALTDLAGNKLAAPFTWRFTADLPRAAGDDFRALTLDGESPALSPDGSQLVFVSKRSGAEKLWIVRTDDLQEKARTARQFIAGNSPARESDPAWSPDGKLLAFVSDGGGSPQIWVAGADGGGARALTPPAQGAALASPTWSPDGKTLAFVRDGNLWQIGADGTGQRALTAIPDRPYQSVRWQPGGQLLAAAFNLYEQRIELYDTASGEIRQLTSGGRESQPAWLNPQTVLFTAPAAPGQPDAIWQIGVDGNGQAILAGSGQPGISDMQADSAASGSATAIVSTRSGTRAVWLRAVLQIAQFSATPASAPAGDPIQIAYSLPAEAEVTLQALKPDGSAVRTILDKARQPKGFQLATWNGTDSANKPVAPGAYGLKLTAKVAASQEPLERYFSVTVLDASNIGNLQIQINQWGNQPVRGFVGKVQIFPAGARVQPAAQVEYTAAPSFKLPAGRYDAVVTLGDLRREVKGIAIEGGKATVQAVDLGLGGMSIAAFSAPGQPVAGGALITVARSDDPTGAVIQFGFGGNVELVLEPGEYDVTAEFQGVRQVAYGVQVVAAQITKRDINLGSGLLRLSVLAYAGAPAEGRTLIVEAFKAGDHKASVQNALFANPLELRLPAGVYDLRLTMDAGAPRAGAVAGHIEQWINGVEVRSGETLTRTIDLKLGQVQVEMFESVGKPADDKLVEFYIVNQGDPDWTKNVAHAVFAHGALIWLRPGSYQIIANYTGTLLYKLGPVGAPFEVKEGQVAPASVNLKLARVRVQVLDSTGQPVKFERLQVAAFPPGKRETREYFSSLLSATPADLIVQAGVAYDLEIRLDNKVLLLTGQSLGEGEIKSLTLKEADFK